MNFVKIGELFIKNIFQIVILIAKYYKKYVVTIIPENTNYCRRNITLMGRFIEKQIHPFAYTSSDLIIESIKDLDMNYVYEQMQLGNIKDISIIDTTCKLYEDSKKQKRELEKSTKNTGF